MRPIMPPCPSSATPLPEDLARERASLGSAVDGLIRRRERHAERERLLRDPTSSLDPKKLAEHREETPRLLQDELALRRRAGDHDAALRLHLRTLADKAHADHEKAQETVRKALRKVGFLEPVKGEPTPGVWTQEMVARHPSVLRGLHLARELHSHATAVDWAHGNVESIRELETKLAAYRERALAGV